MRIQILELPTEVVGEFIKTPFALVVDQVDSEQVETLSGEVVREGFAVADRLREFGEHIGAAGTLITPDTIDIP